MKMGDHMDKENKRMQDDLNRSQRISLSDRVCQLGEEIIWESEINDLKLGDEIDNYTQK